MKSELLAPAGNLNKLKVALAHGADAVYIGAEQFSLRAGADNFDLPAMRQAVECADAFGKKVYVTLNAMPQQEEMPALPELLKEFQKIGLHGLIIADPGVMRMAQEYTDIPCHVSTQASVSNAQEAKFWKALGASRIVLARELTLQEIEAIQNTVDIELEVFVHGAMCTSYSGKCTISNYTAGRDSNRGGCIHSCRLSYDIVDQDSQQSSFEAHIMNSKDLMAIRQIPELLRIAVASLKIEGRMKSELYVANTVSVYRSVIDQCLDGKEPDWGAAEKQLAVVSNRGFSSGSLQKRAEAASLSQEQNHYEGSVRFMGCVMAQEKGRVLVDVRNPLEQGQNLQVLSQGRYEDCVLENIYDLEGKVIPKVQANRWVWLEGLHSVQEYSVLCS